MSKNPTIRRTKKGWRFPSGIEVGDHNLASMLRRIPTEERALIPNKRTLYIKFREAIARRAARLYTGYWTEEVIHKQRRMFKADWWTMARGSYRKHFVKAWFGYERGFMPEDMLDCAINLRRSNKAFTHGKAVPVSCAYGPFVLSMLLEGWQSEDPNAKLLTVAGGPVQTPIPLDQAYIGPRAERKMKRYKRPSTMWEPGLLFDPDTGLYVPPELASASAIDVDAEDR